MLVPVFLERIGLFAKYEATTPLSANENGQLVNTERLAGPLGCCFCRISVNHSKIIISAGVDSIESLACCVRLKLLRWTETPFIRCVTAWVVVFRWWCRKWCAMMNDLLSVCYDLGSSFCFGEFNIRRMYGITSTARSGNAPWSLCLGVCFAILQFSARKRHWSRYGP